MVQLLLESPLVVGVVGGLAFIALLFGWVQTGQSGALWSGMGVLVLTLLGVSVSYLIVTDRETITKLVHQTADDLEANQFEKIPPIIYLNPTAAVKTAMSQLSNCKFQIANITNLHEIVIDTKRQPVRATVRMNVFVEGTLNGYQAKVPRYVELTLVKSGDKWQVQDFRHDEYIKGFQIKD